MLQLPGWLDDQAFALLPRFGVDWAEPGKLIYIYAKSAVVMLAITFALHLLLRAHWIALVGMFSVYPGGVRWENLKLGPIQRRVEQGLSGSPDETIDHADNRATIVFALGVMLASILILVSIGLFITYAVAITLLHRLGASFDPEWVFVTCVFVLFAPFFIANVLDRKLGNRLSPSGPTAGVLAWILKAYASAGMGRWSAPIRLMASNASERKLMVVTMLIVGTVTSATIVGYHYLRRPEQMGDYGLFPRTSATTVSSAYYDDQRDPSRDGIGPFVQSAVILGPYVKLVVPFDPLRDVAALRAQCSDIHADVANQAVRQLACLTRLHAVSIDGKTLPDPGYLASSDPRTDRPALLAMIDIRGLSPGRHEVRVAHPRRADQPVDKEDLGYDVIPIWR
ncbi:MAG: hypothetical protein ABIQ62_05260 [Thermomonas sp.]